VKDLPNNSFQSCCKLQKGVKRVNKGLHCLGFRRKRILAVLGLIMILFIIIVLRAYHYQIAYGERYYKLSPSSPEENSGYEVYVPKDLDDCFVELKKMLPARLIKKIKSKEEFHISEYHLSLGMWIRNNWGLWRGSRLKSYFESKGIHHPDDMSSIILISFHRHLNDEEIGLPGQGRVYQKYGEVISRYIEKKKKKISKEDGGSVTRSKSMSMAS